MLCRIMHIYRAIRPKCGRNIKIMNQCLRMLLSGWRLSTVMQEKPLIVLQDQRNFDQGMWTNGPYTDHDLHDLSRAFRLFSFSVRTKLWRPLDRATETTTAFCVQLSA